MKKFIHVKVGIILLALVASFAAVLFLQHPKADFVVLYSPSGFVPTVLEVPLGAKVEFKNTTDTPLWTASDPHPSHSDYPGFDALRDYAKGEVYFFTFKKTGTFGYHNHEKSIDRGFIHVSDPAQALQDIDKTKIAQRALRDKLLGMLDPKDSNSIFKVIDAIQADPAVSSSCHDMAHDIGHKAYELYGFSEAMTFSNPNHLKHTLVEYICAGGYMHGIVEELFLHQPEFKIRPDLVCASVPDAYRASCFHGVGHALMFSEGRVVSTALTDCRNIPLSKDMYRCFEGLWMEFFWGSAEHSATNSLGWDAERPLAPCIAAKEDEKPTCLLYAPFGYLRNHVKDYSGAVEMCTATALQESEAEFCLKGLGITMMSKFKGKHLESSEVYVKGLSLNKKLAFYEGVLGYARLSGVSEAHLTSTCTLFVNDSDVCAVALKASK